MDGELEISARVEGLDPDEFWQVCPPPRQWASMLAKYEALARVAELAEGPRDHHYREQLSTLARRWPAALREGELIGPERVAARLAAAREGHALGPEHQRRRIDWHSAPARAVLSWAELHALILDLMRFRLSTRARETEALAAWLASDEAAQIDAGGRWPRAELLVEVLGPAIKIRSAYLCLAARAGLELPSLHALLFARSGHWDLRADDPSWAHA